MAAAAVASGQSGQGYMDVEAPGQGAAFDGHDDADDGEVEAYAGRELGRVTRHLVNGGFDFKYDTDLQLAPDLARAVPRRDMKKLLGEMNEVLHKNRTKTGDIVGLFGLMILYAPAFIVRRKRRAKRRRKGLAGVLDKFNDEHRAVIAHVDRVTGDLVVYEAVLDAPPSPPQAPQPMPPKEVW